MVERSPLNEQIFKFKPNKIAKIVPSGNLKSGIKCPKARSGHRIEATFGDIYCFGGYNPNIDIYEDALMPAEDFQPCPLFKELWKFNLVSKTWLKLETKGAMPEELASHATVLVKDKLLVFGGTGVPFGASSSNRLHVCDLTRLEWNQVETDGQKPKEQYGQAIVLHRGYLYVVGGTTGFEYSMDIHRLNTETKTWQEMDATGKPTERYRHEIIADDGRIYIFGGGTAVHSFGFKKVPVFDIESSSWGVKRSYSDKSLPEGQGFPSKRRCHSCVQRGSDIYICGGHDGDTIFSDIWKIQLGTMQWTKLRQSLPRPLYFHSASLTPSGQMFIFGGVTNSNTRTKSLFSMWLTIPPLRDICWLSIQHYIPNMYELSKNKLLAIGLPAPLLDTVDFSTTTNQKIFNEEMAAMP